MPLAVLPYLMTAAIAQTAEPDAPVEAGRDALSQWGRYPWYDSSTDELQRIELVEPWDWDWLRDLFNWNWNWGGGFSMSWLEIVAWTIIALVIGLLIWLLIRAYLQRHQIEETETAADTESPEEEQRRFEALPEPAQRRRTGLLDEAQRQYQAGNYDEAMIYLFSHQLVCLDRNHLIRLTRGKTNRQYLRELKRRDTLQTMLAQTVVAFEDVFFGRMSIGRDRFEACWNRLPQFESLAAREAPR